MDKGCLRYREPIHSFYACEEESAQQDPSPAAHQRPGQDSETDHTVCFSELPDTITDRAAWRAHTGVPRFRGPPCQSAELHGWRLPFLVCSPGSGPVLPLQSHNPWGRSRLMRIGGASASYGPQHSRFASGRFRNTAYLRVEHFEQQYCARPIPPFANSILNTSARSAR
jgi:hypothetical protein